MGKNKVLVKVHPEGKYVVDLDPKIDVAKVTTGARVALKNDSYTLHLLLPTKVDPLVSLMKVEKVPDSTYDMVGGLDQQIREIKEARGLPVCVTISWRTIYTVNGWAEVTWYHKLRPRSSRVPKRVSRLRADLRGDGVCAPLTDLATKERGSRTCACAGRGWGLVGRRLAACLASLCSALLDTTC
jgi:Proteasomal ATPase OB C-terminal domain